MSLFDRFNLGEGFSQHFEVLAAMTKESQDDVFRIRHEVYCEELAFEPVRPDRRETDAFDRHSVHCLLRTALEPHTSVGCTRVVLANPDDPNAPLPFESLCKDTIDRSIIDPARLPRESIGEISRLAVVSRYRRRRGEQHTPMAIADEDYGGHEDHPRFPYIPIGLYLGATALAKKLGLETVFVLTEPRLASHFAKLGFEITQIGGPVEHRGTRVPSMFKTDRTIKNMRFLLKPIWRIVEKEIDITFGHTA